VGIYACQKCIEKHKLRTGWATTSNGICEVCEGEPDPLMSWVPDIHREFVGRGTVKEQLEARE